MRAGDRAPDAPGLVIVPSGEETRLFDLFGVERHVVLVFSGDPDGLGDAVRRAVAGIQNAKERVRVITVVNDAGAAEKVGDGGVAVDAQGHAGRAYGASSTGARVVIVRPDGVIGGLVKNAEGVGKYLTKIFE